MKKITLSLFAVLLCASLTWAQTGTQSQAVDNANNQMEQVQASQNVDASPFICNGVLDTVNMIYDNGPMVTHPGAGSGGHDVSAYQTTLSMTTWGINQSLALSYRVADDFTVPAGETWTITGLTVYSYQTNSSTTSTTNEMNFEILNGEPGVGTAVYGSTTTNVLSHTMWTGIYRTADNDLTNTARPIMKNHADVTPLVLIPGTYWINWQIGGSLSSGPWVPFVSILNQATTGNGKQYVPSTTSWNDILESGSSTPQGLPFKLYGGKIVGINETVVNNIVSVYPNPANSVINVASSLVDINKVTVTNYVGQTVFESQIGEKTTQINVSGFEMGIYFVNVQTNEGSKTYKINVQ